MRWKKFGCQIRRLELIFLVLSPLTCLEVQDSARSFADSIQEKSSKKAGEKAGLFDDEDDGSTEELQRWDQRFQAGSEQRKRR